MCFILRRARDADLLPPPNPTSHFFTLRFLRPHSPCKDSVLFSLALSCFPFSYFEPFLSLSRAVTSDPSWWRSCHLPVENFFNFKVPLGFGRLSSPIPPGNWIHPPKALIPPASALSQCTTHLILPPLSTF